MEWYKLRTAGVKDSVIRNLMSAFKEYLDIFKLDEFQLKKYFNIDDTEYKKIINSKTLSLDKEIENLKKNKVKVLSLKNNNYPEELKNISQPPVFLYYKGDISLLKNKRIGVVGTRKATVYGKITCEKMTEELVNNEITTVSGLALGIDSICHKKTLDKSGKTIAVVGSGLDIIYPKENRILWENIEKYGLIISEYPLGTEPIGYNFPMRNRIIVGLSRGILVIESQKKGGSLITAELALEEGREVFAVPGDIFSPSSEGCNNLIKNSQAKLTTDVKDIITEYGWEVKNNKNNNLNLTSYEEKIFSLLEKEKNLDELILDTSFKASEILSILMDLEIKSAIVSIPGGKYRRKN
ncbi:DNA-processing protein DprA [Fusobacterium sp.]|uniref:DNA-processing protein DprA n=1 Tax=Fusobacterium sp. TaxID=68766 RepID=UPI0029008803|nr:DNA-processing protein DprA [Fusobacterium sp.]MDU1911208.1 DNA-processing protein DprA [Fusobacterium sp.]